MRKIIRIRNLVIVLLVLLFGITGILYFTNNLQTAALKYDLTPFDKTGFINANEKDAALDENVFVGETDRFIMYFDEKSTIVTIYDRWNDQTYQTAVQDTNNNLLKSPFTLEYFDISSVSGNVSRMNGYDNSILFIDEVTGETSRHYKFKYTEDSVQVLYEVGKFGVTTDYFPQRITEQRYQQLFRENPFLDGTTRARLSTYYNPFTMGEGENAQRVYWIGERITAIMKDYLYRALYRDGFQPWDENGEPIWETDENGDYVLDENGELIPVRELYTLELASLHNGETSFETDSTPPRFTLAIEHKLTENGLESKLIRNSIKEGAETGSNHNLAVIDFLPNFIQVEEKSTEKGMIVIPDGSGAVINFNNQKSRYRTYNKGIYGTDMSNFPMDKPVEEQKIMFPMFGFIDETNQKGVLAIVEEGAAQNRIVADIPRDSAPYNKAFFKTSLRTSELVYVGTGYHVNSFTKWSRDIPQVDFTYRFDFLSRDELNYSSLAQKYRQYLIDRYDITEKDTTDSVIVNVNMLGAFERYNSFLGFRYKEKASLTTFAQAQEILTELKGLGVNNINLLYTSWTQDAFENQLRKNIKVSKALGGEKELKNLLNYLDQNNINFYPNTPITTTKGYTQLFGKMRFTSRSISSAYAEHFPYHLSVHVPRIDLPATYYISPDYYHNITRNVLRTTERLNFNSLMLSDLGNFKLANYSRTHNVNLIDGIRYQIETLKQVDKQVDNKLLNAPYDYALKYTNVAVDVPIVSSSYGIFDYQIPFYQLVTAGLFDYSSLSVNGNYQNKDWFFLKVLETGTNLFYDLSYENPNILLETDYNMYFYTYYQNWTYEISELVKRIDDLGIHQGRLIEHQRLVNNVAKVKYSNGIEIIINNSLNDVYYEGQLINANSFKKIKG